MDNWVLAAAWAIALGLALLQAGSVGAAETGQATNTRTGEAYAELSRAIAEAADGDRIELGSGTYEGSFKIGTRITLIGIDTGGGTPIIDGAGETVVLDVTAPGTSIEQLAITSTGAPARPWGFLTPYGEEACLMVAADDVSIAGNAITGCGQGVYVRNTSGAVIYHNRVEDNHIGGIFFLNSRNATVSANTVRNNGYQGITVQTFSFPPGIEHSYRAGKLVGDWWKVTYESRDMADIISEQITISGNVVSGHGSGGIMVGFARRISALANTVQENGGAPPSEIDVAYYGDIAANPLGRGFGIALFCDAYDNIVADNLVRRNDNHGIDVASALNNRIERNVVEGSDWGIMIQGSFGNRIEDNIVTGNAEYGLRIETSRILDEPFLPSVANWILRNSLVNPGVNAFDQSSGDRNGPSQSWRDVAAIKRTPPYPADTLNHWDDGTRGNHYGDFDEAAEGFVDTNTDGIGEVEHPIAGGSAVDHFPLAMGAHDALTGEAGPAMAPATVGQAGCGHPPACGALSPPSGTCPVG